MHKGTYLIAAVLFCTAALAACGASNSASLAPSPDSMTTWVAQGNMDGQDAQEGMGGQDTLGSMDGQDAQDGMGGQDTQESMDGQTAQGESAYHKITASEAKAMMDQGGVTVVDVRREDEYAAGHIPGSILVPNEGIRDTQPEELPDLDAVLLVHCRTGVRSKQASDKLLEIGYKNVYDFGGIVDWPYETVTED